MRLTFISILALCLAVPCLWAQSEQAPTPREDTRPPLPAGVDGDIVPVTPIPELQRARDWSGQLTFTTSCNDNTLASADRLISDCAIVEQPSVAFEQSGSRSSWKFGYDAAIAEHQRVPQLNEVDHRTGIDVQHRFTRRFNVRVREAFTSTSGFGWSFGSGTVPTFGSLQQANDFVITPVVSHIMSTAGVETTYLLSEKSYVGATGSYSILRYRDSIAVQTGLQFTDSDTVTAGALYGHNVGRHNWLGLTYDWQRIKSSAVESTLTDSLLYTHTITLKQVEISGFVGPQYSRNDVGPVTSRYKVWTVAAGGNLGWSSGRTTLALTGVRRISDGGGLSGAADMKRLSITAAQKFTRNFRARVSGYYADSAPLNGDSAIRTLSLTAEVGRRFFDRFLLGVAYGRDWQEAGASNSIERNTVSLSLTYTFGGRFGQ